VAILGLLGLRIFKATSTDIADLGDEHGHRVLLPSAPASQTADS
jgi:integrase/recombinase XerD